MNHVTTAFIVALVAVIIIFDVLQLMRSGANATISSVLLIAAKRWPAIPFALGVVAGHLFFSQGCSG